MADLLDALRNAAQQRQQGANLRAQALQRLQGIPALARQALCDAPRNWIALECLANAGPYAKPDTEQRFVLWEAKKTGVIRVELGDNVQLEHPWVVRLFLPIDSFVRFPFNSGDSSESQSLS